MLPPFHHGVIGTNQMEMQDMATRRCAKVQAGLQKSPVSKKST